MPRELDIIFEDEHVLMVSKPPGMLSIPDRHQPELPNLLSALSARYGKVWVVHRLDKETSGVLCFARHAEAHRHLSMQFEHREVDKAYLALVSGRPESDAADLHFPLAPHPRQAGKMTVYRHGKKAHTRYSTRETFRRFSFLEVELFTGRTHQIRVHLAQIGCPLAVDPMYGNREALYLSEIKGRAYRSARGKPERPLLDRLSLHAFRLSVRHPVTSEPLSAEAALPKDLAACLKQLRKWDANLE